MSIRHELHSSTMRKFILVYFKISKYEKNKPPPCIPMLQSCCLQHAANALNNISPLFVATSQNHSTKATWQPRLEDRGYNGKA